jgi:dihydrofolate reductase
MGNRKVVLFIAMSLDGYIADQQGDIGFLKMVEKDGEDYGYGAFFSTVDVVVLGRKTWDTILTFNIPQPYEGKKVYIISQSRQGSEGNTEYYGEDLPTFIRKLKAGKGLDIFVDGGSQVILSLLKEHLIDRMIISIIPVLLGVGVPLFRPGIPVHNLKITRSREFPAGLVQLEYEVLTAQ